MHPLLETATDRQFVTQGEYPLKLGKSAVFVGDASDDDELSPELELVLVTLEDGGDDCA